MPTHKPNEPEARSNPMRRRIRAFRRGRRGIAVFLHRAVDLCCWWSGCSPMAFGKVIDARMAKGRREEQVGEDGRCAPAGQ